MMDDAKSILGTESRKEEPTSKKSNVKTPKHDESKLPKRPDGMHRELYNLLIATDKGQQEMHSMAPSYTKKGHKNPKIQIGRTAVRKWKWVRFSNEARKDGLRLHHWVRSDSLGSSEPYLFAHLNKVINIPTFSDDEYDEHLRSADWTKDETDYLLDLCRRFDLRWPIILDRYEMEKFGRSRTMEDMKERFYTIVNELQMLSDPSATPIGYDADHERRRKEQMCRLFDRSQEEVEEEEQLVNELRRIEARKRERERKAHDLQKLISMAEMGPSSPSASGGISPAIKKGQFKQKIGSVSSACLSSSFNPEISVSQLRFPEFRGSGAHLRSQEMKLPTNIGQKKLKNIETVIDKLKLEMNPMGSDEIVTAYNDFRSDIILLQELKAMMQTAEFDLVSARNRLQQNGQGFELESRFCVSSLQEGGLSAAVLETPGAPSSSRRITSYLELTSKTEAVNPRKRRAPGVTSLTPSTSASDLKRTRKSVL